MFESMHRFVTDDFTIRVWREEEARLFRYEGGDLFEAFARIKDETEMMIVSQAFEKCRRVTAVEVLDLTGQGSVTYTVWP
jgi:hypothetical protein